MGFLERARALVQRRRPKPPREDSWVTSLQADPTLKEKYEVVRQAQPSHVGELNKIFLEAQMYLRGRDLATCREIIRSAMHVAAAGSADSGDLLEAEAHRAKEFLDQRAQQTARRVYATGLYLGVAISAAVLTAVAFVAITIMRLFFEQIPPEASGALRDVLACLGGGAVGAVVSTILQVSNKDAIDYRVVMLRTAAFRIVLGWLFAAGLFFLIEGGIVTVFTVPREDPVEIFFFWAGVGFLAGFNQVWVRNLVTRTNSPDENSAGGAKAGKNKADTQE
jgi:hypothetical protein